MLSIRLYQWGSFFCVLSVVYVAGVAVTSTWIEPRVWPYVVIVGIGLLCGLTAEIVHKRGG